jgi:copper transport protein
MSRARQSRVTGWRIAATMIAVVAMLLGTRRLALAHATLVSSDPRANSVLTSSPGQIRLVFSEELEPTLARVSLVDGDGHTIPLAPSGDPHDVHALIAPVDHLADGAYRVVWRVVSADGHPVDGSFVFRIGQSAASAPAPPAPMTMEHGGEMHAVFGHTAVDAPLLPSLLRGLALGALMALAGVLYFTSWPAAPRSDRRRMRLALVLAVAAPVLLALHLLAWLQHAAPDHRIAMDSASAALASGVGHTELWRTGLALLSLWALGLARRPRLAFVFAIAALLVSGASGHAAAIHPMWTTPAKALHLLAGGGWLGGLLWLMAREREGETSFDADAMRVSSVALGGVVIVALSGLVQTVLILPALADLVHSAYGAIALAKVAGLLVLVAFGAHHRYRVLPRLATDPRAPSRFVSTLRLEVAVMCIVILLGGVLAYVPPPAPPMAHMAAAPMSSMPDHQ